MNVPLTVVILTKNEADNIRRALLSILWADEIILIDNSTDETVKIAKKLSFQLKVIHEGTQDFAHLRNEALERAKHDWVLFLDADEEVSQVLAAEITKAIEVSQVVGYRLKRKDYFLGKWLKYGETGELALLKLGRKDGGKWKRQVHETWDIDGRIDTLNNPLLHYPHPTVGELISRINRWTTLDAEVFYEQGVCSNAWKIVVYPLGKFICNYFVKLGFLDGMQGLIMAMSMSFHSFLTRAKLYMLQKEKKT